MAKANNALADFQKHFRKNFSAAKRKAFYEECCRDLAARFLRKVIMRTPVGEGSFELADATDKTTHTRYQDEQGNWHMRRARAKDGLKLRRLTNGGTLRRGWTSQSEEEAAKGSGSGAGNIISHVATLGITTSGREYIITCKNPVSYAMYVENGHRQEVGKFIPVLGKRLKQSWVRGQFMMKISADELAAQAPGILERKLRQMLEAVLNGK